MGAVGDWIARNRTWLGLALTALWGAVSADTAFIEAHPRVMLYLGPLAGAILGAGVFKSDEYHKEKQAELKG